MPGSDDEFSDCDLDENEDNDYNTDVPASSQPQFQQVNSGPSSPSSIPPPQWLSSLSAVPISDFTSVGPAVAIPESPS